MRGGGAHVKEAIERPGNALSWRGPATPSRSRSTPTQAGESDPDPCASGDARLLCKNPASGGESPCHPSESRGAELRRNPALGGECCDANRLWAHAFSSEKKATDSFVCCRY